jgi:hypothetical protein
VRHHSSREEADKLMLLCCCTHPNIMQGDYSIVWGISSGQGFVLQQSDVLHHAVRKRVMCKELVVDCVECNCGCVRACIEGVP